jgi:hypothetical protein
MSADAGHQLRSDGTRAARTATRWFRVPDIKVREAEDEPPTLARPRFAWNMGEVSGSLGDLGTFLPHIIGAITVVKMDPTGILTRPYVRSHHLSSGERAPVITGQAQSLMDGAIPNQGDDYEHAVYWTGCP